MACVQTYVIALMISFIISTASAVLIGDCPDSFSSKFNQVDNLGEKCYGIANTKKLTFDAAEEYCQKAGGHLARAMDKSTSDFLHDEFLSHLVPGTTVWIGLRFRHQNKRMIWSDGVPMMYSNIIGGEPDFPEDHDDCYFIILQSKTWYHTSCNKLNPFVCEYSSKPTPTVPKDLVKTTIKTEDCPKNATESENLRVYGDRCYTFEEEELNFAAALKYCEDKGGNLAKVDTQAKDYFIHDTILYSSIFESYFKYWIGLYYDVALDHFEWTLDHTELTYSNFYSEKVLPKPTYDAAAVLGPYEGLWYVEKTDLNEYEGGTLHKFICEFIPEN